MYNKTLKTVCLVEDNIEECCYPTDSRKHFCVLEVLMFLLTCLIFVTTLGSFNLRITGCFDIPFLDLIASDHFFSITAVATPWPDTTPFQNFEFLFLDLSSYPSGCLNIDQEVTNPLNGASQASNPLLLSLLYPQQPLLHYTFFLSNSNSIVQCFSSIPICFLFSSSSKSLI